LLNFELYLTNGETELAPFLDPIKANRLARVILDQIKKILGKISKIRSWI